MERKTPAQLELFSEIKSHGRFSSGASNSFFGYINKNERAILVLIGFIVVGITSFCLGVEKGKRQSVKPSESPVSLQGNSVTAPPLGQGVTGFTIQLASYKTTKYAQKEAEALKRKGFSPFVVSRGDYVAVCVGNFPDKNVAKNMLAELKKQYRDCYIRRL